MSFLSEILNGFGFGVNLWIYLLLVVSAVRTSTATTVHNSSFVPDAVLRVTAQNIKIGGIERLTTLINGSVPGPELRITEGEVAWIRVYNDVKDQNLTIHWHGLAQAAAPFSDGTPLGSQWPIPPHHWFDYELSLPEGTAGTYFYHSHVGFQAVSASGPLIIEDKTKPPYKTDGDRIFYLQELFNKTDDSVEQGIEAVPPVWSGETNGFIINGKTISNFGITDPESAELSIISVEPDKLYRLRFIGAHALSYAAIGIEDHSNLQIIEADGSYTKPHNISFLQLGSGQRFSALFKTKTCHELAQSNKLDYYIQVESRERPANATNYALLSYSNTCNISHTPKNISTKAYPRTPPLKLPPTISGFLDYALRPLQPNNFPSSSEVTRRVIINVQQIDDQWVIWRDSNVTWTDSADDPSPHTTPYKPYLVSLYENQTAYLPSYSAAVSNGGRDPKTNTFPAKPGEVLEIVFQNYGTLNYTGAYGGSLDIHPWHAHGQHYYDAGSGPGAFSPTILERKLKGTEPVLRDTTMLYRYNATTTVGGKQGWRAWRLRVDQPGVWMVHCHTLQHMIMGMQTVWVVGDAAELLRVPRPEVEGYLTYGGSAYGNASHVPEVVHFSELESSTKGNGTG